MSLPTLTNKEIDDRARHLIEEMTDLRALEALLVLNAALARALEQAKRFDRHEMRAPVAPLPEHLLAILHRRPGGRSKIDRFPEVRQFIFDILRADPNLGCVAIAKECRDRFGPERAPEKSAVHRYFQRLRRRAAAASGDR